MSIVDIRNLLIKSEDKLSILVDIDILREHSIKVSELLDLISEFLNDEEKLELFTNPSYQNCKSIIKKGIIKSVSNEEIKWQMLSNGNVDGLDKREIVEIIQESSDTFKKRVLYNQELLEKFEFEEYDCISIIKGLGEDAKAELLQDEELISNGLILSDYQVSELTKGLSNDETKRKIIEIYQYEEYISRSIFESFSDESKIGMILEEGNDDTIKLNLLASLSIDGLNKFMRERREFLKEHGIYPYEIIRILGVEKQKEFVEKLEKTNLTLSEKRSCLVVLREEVKNSVDRTNFPEEYITAINMSMSKGILEVDLNSNLEQYRGLDCLISQKPENFTEEQRTKLIELCEICPNLNVLSSVSGTTYCSNGSEYKEAEEWIDKVIKSLKPEYTAAQKLAIIDYQIGRRISYSPDFKTEEFSVDKSRALWKIISTGYGVCNGIAKVEQYILSRVGIESELVSGSNHMFLKIKNIELPLATGETARGNTILDPTWNLTNHRFRGKPNNFCISYKEAREHDVDDDKVDHECHLNDIDLQDATLSLDEQSLRVLFSSVGLAKEDGQFPIQEVLDKSKAIDETFKNQPEENIRRQLDLLAKTCPEFASCQNSSINILSDKLLNNENLKFNRCIIKRVYDKSDKKKNPVLFIYVDSNELGKRFYFANKGAEGFKQLSPDEFVKRFECYDRDIEENGRI